MEEYRIDYDSMLFDKNGLAEYITVYEEGVPVWYKIEIDKEGAYIVIDYEKHYVLVENT